MCWATNVTDHIQNMCFRFHDRLSVIKGDKESGDGGLQIDHSRLESSQGYTIEQVRSMKVFTLT